MCRSSFAETPIWRRILPSKRETTRFQPLRVSHLFPLGGIGQRSNDVVDAVDVWQIQCKFSWTETVTFGQKSDTLNIAGHGETYGFKRLCNECIP